ncbi:hypothetical protein CPB83DRAFT_841687, partial [Crepidotus variabilis]
HCQRIICGYPLVFPACTTPMSQSTHGSRTGAKDAYFWAPKGACSWREANHIGQVRVTLVRLVQSWDLSFFLTSYHHHAVFLPPSSPSFLQVPHKSNR